MIYLAPSRSSESGVGVLFGNPRITAGRLEAGGACGDIAKPGIYYSYYVYVYIYIYIYIYSMNV